MPDKKPHILLVDDDPEFREVTIDARPLREAFTFDEAGSLQQMNIKLKERPYDLLLLDLNLNNNGVGAGLHQIPLIRNAYSELPIIVVTSEGKIRVVVDAIKQGAVNYLHKAGVDYNLWKHTFAREIENNKARLQAAQLKKENERLSVTLNHYRSQENARYPFIGESKAVKQIKRQLEIVAQRPDMNVLITGETGVGKEVAARYLHNNGPRQDKAFVGVNLSAIQKDLLEAQLFGSRKGGYTGAIKDLSGYFEQANGGVLMLDEIGDIDNPIQIKLLRFLETRLIRPVGSDKDIELNLQVVAATHRDLKTAIREQRFREDLYQRLNVMHIIIPPLRERPEDIPLIMNHFLGREGLDHQVIDQEAMDSLLAYRWRGNIRELKNAVDHILLQREILAVDKVNFDCLPKDIQEHDPSMPEPGREDETRSPEEQKALVDLREIEAALIKASGSKSKAAELWNGKTADDLRYRIVTLYKQCPQLFEHFPNIQEKYSKQLKD